MIVIGKTLHPNTSRLLRDSLDTGAPNSDLSSTIDDQIVQSSRDSGTSPLVFNYGTSYYCLIENFQLI